ncbi:gamma-glutamyltransferase family protein [Aquabacter spiritensis]|uniref:Gamma-glutamyltranspeptidase/glutathione hydrolase n=1 Tax=Aquabacter spiritensis TaxID=933073 RepID=A0A4R3M7L7_9HYPH|nr:gamma-glutamyltransferase [Aquabacter spiritensis]TCT08269.1 gamma-glutamyltranspeptidase/glutathione hydrolase [Aquabacter spiritensis]
MYESTRTARGMVAAPHSLAVEAGRQILAEGGNAIEAAIAAAAAIAVVYPHMNHLGGDGFWLIREPSGKVHYIEACGFAGSAATIPAYRALGYDAIPTRGPLAALTVPGAVGGWALAHEAARGSGGRLPLAELLAPAIAHARAGVAVTRSQHVLTGEKRAELEPAPGFSSLFLPGGKVPEIGDVIANPRLADTLDHLARAGLDDFYRGDVSREMASDLERIGAPLARGDLEAYRAVARAPLSVRLACGQVFNAPPPTQGLASLMILGIFDRLGVKAAESFDHVHGLVEATKRAFLVRDAVVRDFAHLQHDLADLLSAARLEAEAARIDMRRALPWPRPSAKGDTIWLGAADASGRVVSYIQSIFFEFGSGCVLPSTGILMQNRGASFSLDPQATNPLKPGRRPFHTLNPALAQLEDGRVMAYGTMGGEGQPQTQAAVFTRHVLFGEPLGAAIAAPRWLLGRTWGSVATNLRLESRFDDSLVRALIAAGHDVEILPEAFSDTMGHAGAVILHPGGDLEGAHDPRADGGADGI